MNRKDSIAGLILGTAVGDSIGLPREGISRRRAARLFGDGPLRQRLVAGCGMISDDTEHTCLVAQALLASHGEPEAFARSLAWRLRGWFLTLPAGIGLATLKACVRLWCGWSCSASGVYSAGNGPAMRAGLLGLVARDEAHLRELVRRSTRLTHTDPLAEEGARLIALAARLAAADGSDAGGWEGIVQKLSEATEHAKFREALQQIRAGLGDGLSAAAFADRMGWQRGVSGYILHTVTACLFCWLRHRGSFRDGVEAVVRLGGDADTTGAITGALLGASLGVGSIPREWLSRLWDQPRSVAWMTRLAETLGRLCEGDTRVRPVPLCWPMIPVRNAVFLMVVMMHGVRRLLPPY